MKQTSNAVTFYVCFSFIADEINKTDNTENYKSIFPWYSLF